VHDQRQRCEGLGIKRHIRSAHPDSAGARAEIGAGFRFHQRLQRHRRPVQAGDLVVRPSQRLDAAAEHAGEFLDAGRGLLALRQQAAHQTQDVANPVIELRDHQFLPLLRALALARGKVGELQDHLKQRDAQAFGNVQVGLGPWLGLAVHHLAP
jgi:hypothetical protein